MVWVLKFATDGSNLGLYLVLLSFTELGGARCARLAALLQKLLGIIVLSGFEANCSE